MYCPLVPLPLFVLLCNLYMRKTCLFPSLPCMGLLFIWIFIRIYCVVVSFGMLVNYLNLNFCWFCELLADWLIFHSVDFVMWWLANLEIILFTFKIVHFSLRMLIEINSFLGHVLKSNFCCNFTKMNHDTLIPMQEKI